MAERPRISDGDVVKCHWRDEEFYAFVVAAGEDNLAIHCITGPDYRQVPAVTVIEHWSLAWAHATTPLGRMLEFQRGAVPPRCLIEEGR